VNPKNINPVIAAIVFAGIASNLFASGSLESALITPISLKGNDLVFDSFRNMLYMSVGSAVGIPYGNSIVTLDPATGRIIHSTFVGSEPDKLEISADGSRVYVGLNGANGFRWWEPATDKIGPLAAFATKSKATDFAISPTDPRVTIVSKDDLTSTAAGDLEVFRDNVSLRDMGLIYGAESISFTASGDLVGYNSETTGFDLWKWRFDGTNLLQIQDAMGVISGVTRIKIVDGVIFSDNGKAVSASTLTALGTFSGVPVSSTVAPLSGTNTVYFVGGGGFASAGPLQLASFDRKTFLPLDSKTFTNISVWAMRSVVSTGKDASRAERLVYLDYGGNAGIITITPPPLKVGNLHLAGADSGLSWPSEPGFQYTVQQSSDLQNWTTVITTNASRFVTTASFSLAPGARQQFYRVVSN
jgi:hypothetical protein